MRLTDLLTPDAIVPSLKARTKKQALQELSDKAAGLSGLSSREIFDSLLQRERLGSTGIGDGVAIPHGKMPRLKKICGVFARLERPVDFDSLDGAPVDLIFLLMAPESSGADHLKALSCAARMLRDAAIVASIRATPDAAVIYSLIDRQAVSKPHAA
jgi:PTS system nitrogen regulatory IIA component